MPGDFDSATLREISHRPWPMPKRPWVTTQTWHDLLFAHWTIDPAYLIPRIPRPFELDLYQGTAWVGIVPFRMTNVAPRGLPALPVLSSFLELNVRTYVRLEDRPGVYFFSLDASSRAAVAVARALFNLPYHLARMSVRATGEDVEYRSARSGTGGGGEFRARYRGVGRSFTAIRGTLNHFLTERYCLYHHHRSGTAYRMDIHHAPWSLRSATADLERNEMGEANGLPLHGPPTLLFSRRQDMVAWMPVPVGS